MLLAIDSGNTNIVFAVIDERGAIRGQWRSSTDVNRTADEFGLWLTQLMELDGLGRDDIEAAIVASVVPATLFALRRMCQRYFGCRPHVIGESPELYGVSIDMERPEEVGADRIVTAVAAHVHYGGPLVVVDFGTATTFDVIDEHGTFLGGAIAPGIDLSLEILHKAAAQLPRVAIGRPGRAIGKTTVEAMRSGVFWGYAGMIEGLVNRIQAEHGHAMEVIATGGLANLFTEAVEVIDHLDFDLTLKGLHEVHRRLSKAGANAGEPS